ncbi:MAG: hypothetical protein ACRBB0_20100 [Pelagimonas sp.]|uniref:hypothetical protein n=1 Tax=Pelagimonas sp. TaxID=2073170 RepID=UPI003D6B1AE9
MRQWLRSNDESFNCSSFASRSAPENHVILVFPARKRQRSNGKPVSLLALRRHTLRHHLSGVCHISLAFDAGRNIETTFCPAIFAKHVPREENVECHQSNNANDALKAPKHLTQIIREFGGP